MSSTQLFEALKSHFSSLFNSQVEIDATVLDEKPKHEIQYKLGDISSKAEIKRAASKMANIKAPGKSGLTTNMIKNLPPKALDFYVELIQEFWRDDVIDFDSWHMTIMNILYKVKKVINMIPIIIMESHFKKPLPR